jgi:hypothetical protein
VSKRELDKFDKKMKFLNRSDFISNIIYLYNDIILIIKIKCNKNECLKYATNSKTL